MNQCTRVTTTEIHGGSLILIRENLGFEVYDKPIIFAEEIYCEISAVILPGLNTVNVTLYRSPS
ncbi:hypothetical protein J6590_106017, partial [Homalodisca vitripennis]